MPILLQYDQLGKPIPVDYVLDDTGKAFPIDSLPQTLAYTDDVLTSISVTDGTNTWTQTLSYTSDNLTGVSAWVRS